MEMASRLFQSIVLQMKDTVDRTIGIVDASGAVVACTDLPVSVKCAKRRSLSWVLQEKSSGSAVIPTILRETVPRVWSMRYSCRARTSWRAASARWWRYPSTTSKTLYDEKHDKATFVKNIILDNILPGDIYIKSRELHFGNDVPRVVFLIRQQEPADVAAIES